MSQNDFNLANQGFPQMRTDMNSAFQALASNSSGTTPPATTYAYQWWYDESSDTLKIRNSDNDAWINFASFDQDMDSWSLILGGVVVTASAQELNYTDGVTSNIQTQLNGKAANTTQTGATWAAGTSTTESLVSPAKVKAAIDALASSYTDADALDLFNATGSAPVYACRAWLNFSGFGTPSIRASGNVSSITDLGRGDYRINFTTPMPDTNYATLLTTTEASYTIARTVLNSRATGSVQINTRTPSNDLADTNEVNVAIFR